jgi:xylose isomerase
MTTRPGNYVHTDPGSVVPAVLADIQARLASLERIAARGSGIRLVGRTAGTNTAYTNASATESDITTTAGTAPQLTRALDPTHQFDGERCRS